MLDNKNQQNGQALIELIIFLPLMFMFYSLVSSFANAINGSINQQKITRSYFYFRAQNNSFVPKPDGETDKWGTFGMYAIGYMDDDRDNFPITSCYKINIPIAPSQTDKCEESYAQPTTQFIRVQTVYGLCGATYSNMNGTAISFPDHPSLNYQIVKSNAGCFLTR